MYTLDWLVGFRPGPSLRRLGLLTVLALVLLSPRWGRAQAQPKGQPDPSPPQQGKPDPIAEDQPDYPVLHTILVPRDRQTFNFQKVDASLLPRDLQGIWVLDFAYMRLRIVTVNIPGKGQRKICYLYYRVVNRTGAPRMFAPKFIMVNEQDEKFEDDVVPQAVRAIQLREDPSIPVLGGVNIMGILPASTKPGMDDAVYGVAIWEKWDPKADRFSIYVRGLSDGYKEIPTPSDGKLSVKYKTLKLDFVRRGGNQNMREPEIQLADPPHEWFYW
jgi:hypothetical protein